MDALSIMSESHWTCARPGVVADGLRMEDLIGCAFGNERGNNTGRAAFTVQLHLHVGNSMLSVMGHQFLCDIKFGIGPEFNEGFTLGRVNTFDLGGLRVKTEFSPT